MIRITISTLKKLVEHWLLLRYGSCVPGPRRPVPSIVNCLLPAVNGGSLQPKSTLSRFAIYVHSVRGRPVFLLPPGEVGYKRLQP